MPVLDLVDDVGVGGHAVVRLRPQYNGRDAELLAQHALELGEIAFGAFLAVRDESDGRALERGRPRGRLRPSRLHLVGGIKDAKDHEPSTPVRCFRRDRMGAATFSTFWRLAIDAGTDGRGYGFGLAAHPGCNDGAEAASRAAGCHDQKMIRRFERGVNAVAAVAYHRALPDIGPFRAADARAL